MREMQVGRRARYFVAAKAGMKVLTLTCKLEKGMPQISVLRSGRSDKRAEELTSRRS